MLRFPPVEVDPCKVVSKLENVTADVSTLGFVVDVGNGVGTVVSLGNVSVLVVELEDILVTGMQQVDLKCGHVVGKEYFVS